MAQSKPNLVLMPLDISEEVLALETEFGAALQQGLQVRYKVFYGKRVEQVLDKEYTKIECTAESCQQSVAIAFNSELLADASVKKVGGGYIARLVVLNVLSGEIQESLTLPCRNCDQFSLIDGLQALGRGEQFYGKLDPVVSTQPTEFLPVGQKIQHEIAGGLGPTMLVIPSFNDKQLAVSREEITQQQFQQFAQERALKEYVDDKYNQDLPMINISWSLANEYTSWLSEETGSKYRLPSVDEWRFFTRAGSNNDYYWGNKLPECDGLPVKRIKRTRLNMGATSSDFSMLTKCVKKMKVQIYAHCSVCYSWAYVGRIMPSNSFKPNKYGLYSTLGNVAEWTNEQVYLGGHWRSDAYALKIMAEPIPSDNGEGSEYVGFRPVLELN